MGTIEHSAAQTLWSNERAVLRVLATTGQPMTIEQISERLRAGVESKLAVGVADAVRTLDAIDLADIAVWSGSTPTHWIVTPLGSAAIAMGS